MKNQNLKVRGEPLDDHEYMILISIQSLWNFFWNSFSERYKLQFEIKKNIFAIVN